MPENMPGDYWEKRTKFSNESAALNFKEGLENSGYLAKIDEVEGEFVVSSYKITKFKK